MEKFTGREKIAIGVILLIFLAIAFQVAVRLELFGLGPSGVFAKAVPNPGPGANLIIQKRADLTVSSLNSEQEGAGMLVDGNPTTYWHISLLEVGKPAEITVDFGPGNKTIVRSVLALPRANLPSQFLRRAELLGSDDGKDWEPVTDIILREVPEQAEWWRWDFPNDRAYRFWLLRILQGHEDGSRRNFYSIAELKFEESHQVEGD